MESNRPKFTKWVACWGNATSITDRKECVYARDLTLRYPVRMCFDRVMPLPTDPSIPARIKNTSAVCAVR